MEIFLEFAIERKQVSKNLKVYIRLSANTNTRLEWLPYPMACPGRTLQTD
jgi:hypothetical protein